MPSSQLTAAANAARGGKQAPGFHRTKVGSFELIALHDGTFTREIPKGFIKNASDEEAAKAWSQIGIRPPNMTITFTTFAVITDDQIVLIDVGYGDGGPPTAGNTVANLKAAGIDPKDVGTVLISHFHGDHITGLRLKDGTENFPNAEIVVPQKEWDFWMDEARANSAPDGLKPSFAGARRVFDPIPNKIRKFNWGDEVLPGFKAIQADGHTPGMTAFLITSGDDKVLFTADITNNPYLFARRPEWQVAFDMDGERAVETRKKILEMAAKEELRLAYFHAPFPATGYVIKNDQGYEFVPVI